MKVYITHTPEFPADKVDEVISLLQEFPGELIFDKVRPLTQVQCKRLNSKFENIDEIESLSFDEYFDFVKGYRELREVDEQDFLVLISSIGNNQNWFSAFNKRNIFVTGDEWDNISKVDSKFYLAYECLENILQSLMGLDINDVQNEPNIHMESIGCINDFCGSKNEILLKMRTADICSSCLNRAERNGHKYILIHILNIIERIRKAFVASFIPIDALKHIDIYSDGAICIDNKPLKLEPLPHILYLSFLQHLEGFPSNCLCKNKTIFEENYKKIRHGADLSVIEAMLCKKNEIQHPKVYHKPTFEVNRSRVKKALINALGITFASNYHINCYKDTDNVRRFKIPLPDNLIHFK